LPASDQSQRQDLLSRFSGLILDSGPPFRIDEDLLLRAFVGATLGLYQRSSHRPMLLPTHEQAGLQSHHHEQQPLRQVSYNHWLLTPIGKIFFKLLLKLPFINKSFEHMKHVFLEVQVIWILLRQLKI
jgi:hypothetical protein